MEKFVQQYEEYLNALRDSTFKKIRIAELKQEQELYDVRGRYSPKFTTVVLSWVICESLPQ